MRLKSTSTPLRDKKVRLGARGGRKVRTGCLTCKIRRKKCDELKPACTQCLSTQRTCDFQSDSSPCTHQHDSDHSSNRNPSLTIFQTPQELPHTRRDLEIDQFAYFQTVCAPEFLLYFEDACWGTTVLQAAYAEPCIYHATVAIGALSRSQYHPQSSANSQFPANKAFKFAMKQYNLAIQAFSTRLDDSARSTELALLGSLVFIALEVLMDIGVADRVMVHLRSAFALLQHHIATHSGSSGTLESLSRALHLVDAQFSAFRSLDRTQNADHPLR